MKSGKLNGHLCLVFMNTRMLLAGFKQYAISNILPMIIDTV